MEKEETMVLYPFMTVTAGKESIRAEVGQEHLKPQGFPEGSGMGQKCNRFCDMHGQDWHANPY